MGSNVLEYRVVFAGPLPDLTCVLAEIPKVSRFVVEGELHRICGIAEVAKFSKSSVLEAASTGDLERRSPQLQVRSLVLSVHTYDLSYLHETFPLGNEVVIYSH